MKGNDTGSNLDLTIDDPDLTEVVVPVSGFNRAKNVWVRIAAFNSVGLGPFSEPLLLDAETTYFDENELVLENSARYTWLIALFGSFVFMLILVLSVLVYHRKRVIYSRKTVSANQVNYDQHSFSGPFSRGGTGDQKVMGSNSIPAFTLLF